jgi:hypothetical protein
LERCCASREGPAALIPQSPDDAGFAPVPVRYDVLKAHHHLLQGSVCVREVQSLFIPHELHPICDFEEESWHWQGISLCTLVTTRFYGGCSRLIIDGCFQGDYISELLKAAF